MNIKPKYKLGQKVILVDINYVDGKSDVGYITGIEVMRSYSSAGLFQFGGLNLVECEMNGFLETYMNHVDVVVYHVIRTAHSTGDTERTREILESKLVPYNKENAKKYVE